MPTIRTLRAPLRHEIPKVKGSRFIASATPVASAAEASAFVAARRDELRDATHNCFAWRLAAGDGAFRFDDDGEPSGTAGRPILRAIDGRELIGVAVVVTRYYGGTKLGTGGLARAYGGAAAAVLELAEIVETPIVQTFRLRHPYELAGTVTGVLAAFGVEPASAEYGADVELTVAVPVEDKSRFADAVREATAGRAHLTSQTPSLLRSQEAPQQRRQSMLSLQPR